MAKPQITRFKGLNNVSDSLRLSDGWLTKADNVNVTDTGAVVRRDGYSVSLSGGYTGAFTTEDFSRMYVIDGGNLKRVRPDMTTTTLQTGISSAPMYWTEINRQIFFTNGVNSGVISQDDDVAAWGWAAPVAPELSAVGGSLNAGVYQVAYTFLLPDGRETGTSLISQITIKDKQNILLSSIPQRAGGSTLVYIAPADSTVFQLALSTTSGSEIWSSGPNSLGRELMNAFLGPLPANAGLPEHWRGRIYLAEYLPSEDISVIWMSEPLGFHLFNLDSGFFMVPGRCLALCPTDEYLIVGTDTKIFGYTPERMNMLAQYGVVPGRPWAADENGDKWLWTTHGVCSALPFSNITLNQISVQSGLSAGAAIVQKNGVKQFVVALQRGGIAFNQRT